MTNEKGTLLFEGETLDEGCHQSEMLEQKEPEWHSLPFLSGEDSAGRLDLGL